MKLHELKIPARLYEHVINGDKKFELRRNDRNFQPGDLIWFRRFDDETNEYMDTGSYSYHAQVMRIQLVMNAGEFEGLQEGFCILQLQRMKGKGSTW